MKRNIYFVTRSFLSLFFIFFIGSCTKNKVLEPEASPSPLKPTITTDSVFIISEGPSGVKKAKRLQQRFPSADFSPTGLYLPPGAALQVNVQLEAGTKLPQLLVGTYSRDTAYWNPITYELKKGINTITNNAGGLIYLRYVTDEVPTGKASIQFISGYKPVPFYVLGKTTHDDWLYMLNTFNTVPDVMLVSNRAMIVTSFFQAIQYKDEHQDTVLRMVDEVINEQGYISGLDGSQPIHQPNAHKFLMTETNKNTFTEATWFRNAFHSNVIKHLLTANGFGKEGWEIWHTLGHMHQQHWSWNEVRGATVDIYTLAAERIRGITPSRLHRDNIWEQVSAYLSLPNAKRDFNTKANNWVKLWMFQQLWVFFGDKFYHQLHQRTRQKQPILNTTADKMRYFMLSACLISGTDLSNFFTKWGFKVSQSVYDEMAALHLPLLIYNERSNSNK